MLRFFQSSGTAFLAGTLSLVSQIVGLQIVARELASTDLAIASVLISGLFGLSLGAFVSGRWSDSSNRRFGLSDEFPLWLAHALLGMASIAMLVFSIGGTTLAAFIRELGWDVSAEVFCFSLGTILPVNFLLGGIVPVLTRATVSETSRNVQNAFGRIYALETCGAALGSLGVTFYAIPRMGVRLSLTTVSAVVLAWTVLWLLVHWKLRANDNERLNSLDSEYSLQTDAPRSLGGSDSDRPQPETAVPVLRWVLLIAATASSCASLGMELVWQRYFAIVFGSDSHSYAIVATLFLAGNSIGALFVSRVFGFLGGGRSSGKAIYQWQLLLIGGSILLSVWTLGYGFRSETMRSVLGWLTESPLLGRLLLGSIVLLLPSVLIGSALPVLVDLCSAGSNSLGTRAGEIYACVIAGNIVGVLLCASWLIPTFGLRITAVVLAGICVTVSLGLSLLSENGSRSPQKRFNIAAISGYSILLIGTVGGAVWVTNSDFRPGLSDDGTWVVDHYVEKASHTLAVAHNAEFPDNKRMIIDGVTIGESGGGVGEKQQVLAHLPFMIGEMIGDANDEVNEEPNDGAGSKARRSRVLTIGLGTGILAGELAVNDQVKSLTCVELSSEVIKASKWFAKENRQVLDSPKLNLIHGDGVRYLRNADQVFDVIVSDGKSRPGAAANLPFFSQEYYRLCFESLSEQGVFVQWVSLRCDPEELKTILFTFSNQFSFGHIAIAAPDSIYMVGARSPISFNRQTIDAYLQHDWTKRLRGYSWNSTDDILAMYWLDDEIVHNGLATVAANTFDRPVLDRFAWKSFQHSLTQQPTQLGVLQELIADDTASLFNGHPLDQFAIASTVEQIQAGRKGASELMKAEAIRVAVEENWLDRSTVHFKNAIQHLPQLTRQNHIVEDFRFLAEQARTSQDVNTEFSTLINISELNGSTADEEIRMANILEDRQAAELALNHYFKAVKISNAKPSYLIGFGEALMKQRRHAPAKRQFERAVAAFANDPPPAELKLKSRAKLLSAIADEKLGRAAAAKPIIDEILQAHPELLEVYRQFSFPSAGGRF